MREWESSVGVMHEFVVIPGEKKIEATIGSDGRLTEDGDATGKVVQLDKFSMGGLKGYQIALGDLESQGVRLQVRDKVTISCVDYQRSNDRDKDDMAMFSIDIER